MRPERKAHQSTVGGSCGVPETFQQPDYPAWQLCQTAQQICQPVSETPGFTAGADSSPGAWTIPQVSGRNLVLDIVGSHQLAHASTRITDEALSPQPALPFLGQESQMASLSYGPTSEHLQENWWLGGYEWYDQGLAPELSRLEDECYLHTAAPNSLRSEPFRRDNDFACFNSEIECDGIAKELLSAANIARNQLMG